MPLLYRIIPFLATTHFLSRATNSSYRLLKKTQKYCIIKPVRNINRFDYTELTTHELEEMLEDTLLDKIKKAQYLTKRYAYYTQTWNGWGTILAGCIYTIIYIIWHFSSGILASVLAVSLVSLWLFGKEIIRRKCYQSIFDEVVETIPKLMKFWHVGAVILLALLAVDYWAMYILSGSIENPNSWLPLLIYFSLAPIAKYFWRSPIDFLCGFILLLICIGIYQEPFSDISLQDRNAFTLLGLWLILFGAFAHIKFSMIAKEVEQF